MRGKVYAVCKGERVPIPKKLEAYVRIAKWGIEGDFHCKPMRQSFSKPGTEKPNDDRHILIISIEALRFANQKIDIALEPGATGENIVVKDMGFLSEVTPGSTVRIGKNIVLKVTGQETPCRNLTMHHNDLMKTLVGKRGIMCAVVSGIGESVMHDDLVSIKLAKSPKV